MGIIAANSEPAVRKSPPLPYAGARFHASINNHAAGISTANRKLLCGYFAFVSHTRLANGRHERGRALMFVWVARMRMKPLLGVKTLLA